MKKNDGSHQHIWRSTRVTAGGEPARRVFYWIISISVRRSVVLTIVANTWWYVRRCWRVTGVLDNW